MFAEKHPRPTEGGKNNSYNPGSESQGGFSELSISPEKPNALQKRIKELWTMQPRYTSRYTEEEFNFFVRDIAHLLADPRYGLDHFLPPVMKTSWDESLPASRGTIEMSKIDGQDLEHMQSITLSQAQDLDRLLAASVRIDVETKDWYTDRQMRVRPDVIQVTDQGKPYFHSIMFGVPSGENAAQSRPQWYLIDTYPAYYFTQFDQDFDMEDWKSALQNLSKRSGDYAYPLLNSALIDLEKGKLPQHQRSWSASR